MKSFYKLCILGTLLWKPLPAFPAEHIATIAAGHSSVFLWVKMLDEAFIPAVTEALDGTEHSLRFITQYGGAIAGVGEELEAVEAGLAELGICPSLFEPSKLAPQNVTYYTPFVTVDVRKVSDVMHQLQRDDRDMQKSYADAGVVYIGAPVVLDDYLLMTNFPVHTLLDLDGRRIAAPGAALNWLSGTGAVGVSGNLSTYYNELKTGVYDGVFAFASAALPSKLYEVAPYITRVGFGAQYAGSICANIAWFNGLPIDVQAVLLEAADVTQEWYVSSLEDIADNALKVMAENGATITDASDELRIAWAENMDDAARMWAEHLDDRGQSGTKVLNAYLESMRESGAIPLRDWGLR